VRDGLPLPGTTPAQVLSQLAHRVSGPLRTERARTLMDYHGVGGEPAGTVAQVAARHAVSGRTLSNWVAALRAAGSRLPLSAELITQMTRRSAEGEDHLGRVRTSKTFGVPSPARPSPPSLARRAGAGRSAGSGDRLPNARRRRSATPDHPAHRGPFGPAGFGTRGR